uniref:hypothetical protein n=1 Tax=Inquilinus sp. OTU3971 TaxID=3043855 RepID=UPI00406C9F45
MRLGALAGQYSATTRHGVYRVASVRGARGQDDGRPQRGLPGPREDFESFLRRLQQDRTLPSQTANAFHAIRPIDRLAGEAESAHKPLDRLDQAVLAKAFRGELVLQDPAYEPASFLLDRIRAERAAKGVVTKGRGGGA